MSLVIGMKPCSTLVVLCALLFSNASFVSAEERSFPVITTLSSTTLRGYIETSGDWQRHVCRPVRPVRVQRLYKLSHGVIREIGYTVRCRHGAVYLPHGSIAELLPAPNRSSGLAPGATTPRIDGRTAVILIEASRIPRRPGRPFPPLPPLPPTDLEGGSEFQHLNPPVLPPLRPQPTNSVTPPPVVVVVPQDPGGLIMIRVRRDTPPPLPPPPPAVPPPLQ